MSIVIVRNNYLLNNLAEPPRFSMYTTFKKCGREENKTLNLFLWQKLFKKRETKFGVLALKK